MVAVKVARERRVSQRARRATARVGKAAAGGSRKPDLHTKLSDDSHTMRMSGHLAQVQPRGARRGPFQGGESVRRASGAAGAVFRDG
jgi:hypothetical protein